MKKRFRHIAKEKKNCHYEPVTDVTGVEIPNLLDAFSIRIPAQPGNPHASLRTGSE